MAGGFTLTPELCNGTDYGTDVTNARGTAVTCASGAYGTWTQLVASTGLDTSWMRIVAMTNGGSNTQNTHLFNLGIGAAGSEVLTVSGLSAVQPDALMSYSVFILPISIPAGTRIAAQGTGGTDVIYLQLQLFSDGYSGFNEAVSGLEPISSNLTNSNNSGAVVSGAIGVKGAYTQVVGSTARDYCGLYFAIAASSYAGSMAQDQEVWDIAIGAASSEIIVVPNIIMVLANKHDTAVYGPFMIEIPAGTRISLRFSSATAASSGVYCNVWGIYR